MPLIQINLADGRTDEQKRALLKAVTDAVQTSIGAPLADFPSKDALADTARTMALIETQVRRVPPQYLWIHKRFKTQPEDTPSPYA